MGIVQAGSGAANARTPIGTGPYTLVPFLPDDRLVLTRFDDYFGAARRNTGVVLKVVPDDTMRGLELRKGTVDLVVNDVAPDIVWQMQRERKPLQIADRGGTDYAYIGLNLTRPDPAARRGAASDRLRHRSPGHRPVSAPRATPTAVGIIPPMSWAFERAVFDFHHDPAEARRLLDAAGFPRPRRRRPAPRFSLTMKTSTSEVYRIQAAAIQQDLARVGIARGGSLAGVRDAARRHGAR